MYMLIDVKVCNRSIQVVLFCLHVKRTSVLGPYKQFSMEKILLSELQFYYYFYYYYFYYYYFFWGHNRASKYTYFILACNFSLSHFSYILPLLTVPKTWNVSLGVLQNVIPLLHM
jgi:hypothetical protein